MRKNRKGEIVISGAELEDIRKYQYSVGYDAGKAALKSEQERLMLNARLTVIEHAAQSYEAISRALVALVDPRVR